MIFSVRALALGLLLTAATAAADGFRDQQLAYPRVKKAYAAKARDVKELFRSKGLPFPPKDLYVRVFKQEDTLELWAGDGKGPLTLVKSYAVCARSGELGPKRKEGDGQVPEGFYEVSVFNPWSNFHLSLGVSYPNASDRILGEKGSLGGAIMIHGNCVTIGCIPLTDPVIEEVYLAAVEARGAGQKSIPIHIFPARFDEAGKKTLAPHASRDAALATFWTNLEEGYQAFEAKRRVPRVTVDKDGRYHFR